MRKLYIDMDNTLNDFSNYFVTWVKDKGYKYNKGYLKNYDIQKGIRTSNNKQLIKEEIFIYPQFWLGIPALNNIKDAIRILEKYFDVYILTYPWRNTVLYKSLKQEWISKYLPSLKNKIIFSSSHNKWTAIEKDSIIIDDNPCVLNGCIENGITTVVFNQPYNKRIKSNHRLYNWSIKEITKLIKEINK